MSHACQEPQGEPRKDSSWSPRAPWPCPHLDFERLATRTGGAVVSAALSHGDMVICYGSHRKRMQLAECRGHLPALLPAQGDCQGLRLCPRKSTCWVPNVLVPEGGALGGVMRGWVASRGDEETRALFPPREDTVRSRQFATRRGFSAELDQADP